MLATFSTLLNNISYLSILLYLVLFQLPIYFYLKLAKVLIVVYYTISYSKILREILERYYIVVNTSLGV